MALLDRFGVSNILSLIWRFLEFIFGVTVIGLYAQDLNNAHREHKYTDSKWAYAVAVGTLAAISALVLGIVPMFSRLSTVSLIFAWEWILVILWAAVVGVFGTMYLNANPEGDNGIVRMHNAVIIDILNLCLWAISAIALTVVFFTRNRQSLHTGRAKV